MSDYYAKGIPEMTRLKRCRICGKRFKYYPAYHYWKARVDGHTLECVCSYTCMRVIEKREAELAQLGIKADFEAEDGLEIATRKRTPKTPDKAKILACLKEKLASAEKQFQERFDEENALRYEGVWETMNTREKEKVRKRRYYWQVRIDMLQREIAQLNNAAATATKKGRSTV